MPEPNLAVHAAELHRTAFVADGHCDTIGRFYFEGGSFSVPAAGQHLDLERLAQGGVGLQVLALCPVWRNPSGRCYAEATLGMLDTFYRERDAHPPLTPVTGTSDLLRLREARGCGESAVGVVLGIEGGCSGKRGSRSSSPTGPSTSWSMFPGWVSTPTASSSA